MSERFPKLSESASPGGAARQLTNAQWTALSHADWLEKENGLAIFPRRGQQAMFDGLVLRGLLTYEGPGVDADDHMHDVRLYRLTELGRSLAGAGGRGAG